MNATSGTGRPVVVVYVCGIMTLPGSSMNWTGRAATWTHKHAARTGNGMWAEKVEYASFLTSFVPVLRQWAQRRRVRKLRRTISHYLNEAFLVHLVGHSNGCAVILQTLKEMNWPRVPSVHFIAAAAPRKLGWMAGKLGDQLGHLYLHIGEKDIPLRIAGTFTAGLMGYGDLGLRGPDLGPPKGLDERHMKHVTVTSYPEHGHSTFFEDEHFDTTMATVLRDVVRTPGRGA